MTSSEIAVRQPATAVVAERDTVDGWIAVASDVIKVANLIAETEFVPAEYRDSAPAVAAAILTGRELGIGPMMSLRHVQLVKGVPTLSAEYKRARVLAAGHDFEVMDLTTQRCKVRGRRAGTTKWLEITFTMDDARTAQIVKDKGAWKTRPRRMLFARAGSELCDFIFADVTNGLPTAELVAEGADDDEFAGYNESAAQAPPGNGAAPAARTARRRQPAQEPADRPSAAPSAPGSEGATRDRQRPAPAATARSGQPSLPPTEMIPVGTEHAGLPPLPGEDEPEPAAEATPDETDYDTPGTITRDQLTAMWATFSSDLGFTRDDKPYARQVCEKITGRTLLGGTTGNLSRNEASVCIDTLKRCRTRERLIVLMNDGELPADDETAGGSDG